MEKKWQLLKPDAEAVKNMSRHLPCHPITAAVLINRKLTSLRQATDFLTSSLDMMRSPFALKDMEVAVNRIYRAIAEKENILIFGDYDVDGISATAVMLEFFKHTGARVSCYIPHRLKEGYSLQPQHIHNHALPNQIRLIITADCGSGSHDAIVAARRSGIDVIVTDHHRLLEQIPPAAAVINPKRRDCASGMEALSGVGVAFALIIALRKQLRDQNFWRQLPEPNLKNLCDLVALGTIGDMVPLIDENRIFSKAGLECINALKRPGIKALCEVAGISNRSTNAEDVAFKLVPRLNAAGRMAHAVAALQLLTTEDPTTARNLAASLNGFNSQRQKLERLIFDDILTDLQNHPERLQKKTLVGWHPAWHQGVLGIVASRVIEAYHRPVVLVAVKGELGKGSARSIPGLDLFQALQACRHYLEDFGGHAMAAGLTVKVENLVEFQQAFDQAVGRMSQTADQAPLLAIDTEMGFDDLTDQLVDEIEALGPFGNGNPEPVFMTQNIKVLSSKVVGNNHLKMAIRQDAGPPDQRVSAICFNASDKMLGKTAFARLAFRLQWNRWNERKNIQLIIEDAS
jgi:single-stranded-DNA-specific exonuclease